VILYKKLQEISPEQFGAIQNCECESSNGKDINLKSTSNSLAISWFKAFAFPFSAFGWVPRKLEFVF
jgi:hypothetical protein